MLSLSGKCVQINPGDEGRHNMVEGICLGLHRDYPDWRSPQTTHMVPDLFPSDQGDKGAIAEKKVYNLLQNCGTQRKEPMFVVHSFPFSEHIPDSKRQISWVMGKTDFVIIHKIHGPIFLEVEATDTGKNYKEAEEQLQKGKLALQKRLEKAVEREIPTNRVIEIFRNFPAFVAMPNCPRPSEVCALKANALYQEDCSSLEGFDKWWNYNIVTEKHPDVNQQIYEDLVIWFVGMSCLKPLGLRLDDHYRTMISQTQQQMKILARNYPSVLWIRGPAGSGKTILLIEKAIALAKGILDDHGKANEKILVLCHNRILCKALEKTVKGKLPADQDVSSFLHFKTFSKLLMSLSDCHKVSSSKELWVNLALENLQTQLESTSGIHCSIYDHILVDEGHDFCGNNWPKLLQLMHKNFHFPKEDFLAKPGIFWVMYDSNQHLYFAKERASLHGVHLRNSAKLNEVFRNTGHIFEQSRKYFKSLMPNDGPIRLGHGLPGLPIEWDHSLVSRSDEGKEGAKSVIQWLWKLRREKVHPKDICILVENREKLNLLQRVISFKGGMWQTGDELVENSRNCVVLETTRRFKGLESKVVILYNPPFQDGPSICTKDLLYTAVSRCSCFLVVISTQEGCMALKSDVGVKEESRGKRPYTSRRLRRAANVLQSQQQVDVNDVSCSHQESGSPERHFKQPSDDDDDDEDVSFSEPLKISPDQIKMYVYHHELRGKQAASNEPRPKEVDGSNLIEPGDQNMALKSDVGVKEESRGKRPYTSRHLRRAANVLQSQQQVVVNDVNDISCSRQESGYPERHFKLPSDDDDDDDVSFSEPLKISPDQIKMYVYHHELREKQAASNEPRPKEVYGSNLIEPGDQNITDAIRGKAFTLLEEEVRENLKYIPDVCKMNYTMIIAAIEYKAYQKRRAECRPHNYTADLRKLKKEISACNQKSICHYCVMDALESATKIRGEV